MRRMLSLVLCLVSGCSFAFVSGPPANHRQLPAVECTTSRIVPGLDTVWTALQALNLGLAASQSDAEWDETFDGDPPFGRSTALGIYGVLAAAGAVGMYYGFTKTGACREAKNELLIRAGGGGATDVGTWPPPTAPVPPGPTPTPPAPTPPAPPAPPAPPTPDPEPPLPAPY